MGKMNDLEANVQNLVDLKVMNLDVSLASIVKGGALAGLDPWDVFCGNGWVLRDVYRGAAILQSRTGGLIEVGPGDVLPGVGRIEAVRRQDGHWVVITAIDEHLHVPGRAMDDYLAEQTARGPTILPALGFDMNHPTMPKNAGLLVEQVTRGRPRIAFNKLSVFNPDAVLETGFGAGQHKAKPVGDLKLPHRNELVLWHYKHLEFDRCAAREAIQLPVHQRHQLLESRRRHIGCIRHCHGHREYFRPGDLRRYRQLDDHRGFCGQPHLFRRCAAED